MHFGLKSEIPTSFLSCFRRLRLQPPICTSTFGIQIPWQGWKCNLRYNLPAPSNSFLGFVSLGIARPGAMTASCNSANAKLDRWPAPEHRNSTVLTSVSTNPGAMFSPEGRTVPIHKKSNKAPHAPVPGPNPPSFCWSPGLFEAPTLFKRMPVVPIMPMMSVMMRK